MNVHYNSVLWNSILFFTQIQENLQSAHTQGGTAACKLRLGLEAANDQLETTVLVCGQVSLWTLHTVANVR